MDLAKMIENMKEAQNGPIEVESSIETSEGLLIICADGDSARRMGAFVKAILPAAGHHVVEITDRRVMLKYPEGMEAWERVMQ